MNPYELTFFEFHSRLYKFSLAEINKSLNIDCCDFTRENFAVTPKQLLKINPTQAGALIGELYHQQIKKKNIAVKELMLSDVLPLTKLYHRGFYSGTDCFQGGHSTKKLITSKPLAYREGYEDGYTGALLNSTLSSFQKGGLLGNLATILGKKNLTELRICDNRDENRESNLLLHEPNFLKGFNEGIMGNFSKAKKSKGLEIPACPINSATANQSPITLTSTLDFDPSLMINQKSPKASIPDSFPSHGNVNDLGATLNNPCQTILPHQK